MPTVRAVSRGVPVDFDNGDLEAVVGGFVDDAEDAALVVVDGVS